MNTVLKAMLGLCCCCLLVVLPAGAKCPTMDVTGDCFVDLEDFAVFTGQWLTGTRIPAVLVEDFETGDFSRYPWQHSGDALWTIDADTKFAGVYAARSGAISHNQTSTIEITLDTPHETISFYRKVSSENGYDYLRFKIDGVEVEKWSGDQDWDQRTFYIAPGAHTFQWSYTKDGADSSGSDCAWLDNITLFTPITVLIPAVVGLIHADAAAALASAGLVEGTVTETYCSTVAAGYVISQTPSAGKNAWLGSVMNLVVSKGPEAPAFVTIPAGSFQMGDNFNEGGGSIERPVHSVTLSSFNMSKHEVTNAQYVQFLNAAKAQGILKEVGGIIYAIADSSNSKPWCDTSTSSSYSQIVSSGDTYSIRIRDGESQADHPVVRVSWYGAKAFCDFYGYLLPTEAQWEYGARGSLAGQRFPWGATINHTYANYRANSSDAAYDTSPYTSYTYHPTYATGTEPYTSPVGSFVANGYGLYDMSGNVWEWCSDWYSSYSSSAQNNPTGPANGTNRVFRGGGWYSNAYLCRVANRNWLSPDTRHFIGFRVCRP